MSVVVVDMYKINTQLLCMCRNGFDCIGSVCPLLVRLDALRKVPFESVSHCSGEASRSCSNIEPFSSPAASDTMSRAFESKSTRFAGLCFVEPGNSWRALDASARQSSFSLGERRNMDSGMARDESIHRLLETRDIFIVAASRVRIKPFN